jgi:hypothetical protein
MLNECPCCKKESGIMYIGYTLAECKDCDLKFLLYTATEVKRDAGQSGAQWCIPIEEFKTGEFAMARRKVFKVSVPKQKPKSKKEGGSPEKEKVKRPKKDKKRMRSGSIPKLR